MLGSTRKQISTLHSMKNIFVFALLTGLCWGLYGPALASARTELKSPFKPYLAIGLAYLVWGVLGGYVAMKIKGESFTFTGAGFSWAFVAGSLGAFGALALTMSMVSGGAKTPHLVMPVVFGSAVVLSGVVGYLQTRATAHTPPLMWVGILLVAIGIVLTCLNTPSAHKAPVKVARVPQPVAQ